MIEFQIPLDGAVLLTANLRKRLHWGRVAKVTRDQRLLAEICARSQDFKAATGPRKVSLTLVRGKGDRLLDLDGLGSVCKPFVDGLVDAGVLAGDSPKHASFTFQQERADKAALLVRVEEA